MLRDWFFRLYRRFFRHEPVGNVLRTSITLGYRKDAWGLERIVLDTVANHLPSDSGGKQATVEFLTDGAWHELDGFDQEAADTIRVRDDGPGYSHELLGLLYSTKRANGANIGQFGEGLKLVAAACLREKLPVRYRSRTWSAVPYAVREEIDGRSLDRLCFLVGDEPQAATGSQTLFERPTPDLVRAFRRLPQLSLAFRRDLNVLYERKPGFFSDKQYHERIIDLEDEQGVFIKGMLVAGSGDRTILSYDLDTGDIAPDRHFADPDALLRATRTLLHDCENPEVPRRILLEAAANPQIDRHEYNALDYYTRYGMEPGLERDVSRRWVTGFSTAFGEKAALTSEEYAYNEDARGIGFSVIALNPRLRRFLRSCGVRDTKSLFTAQRQYVWVDERDLSVTERDRFELISELNAWAYAPQERVTVKVFEQELRAIMSIDGAVVRYEPVEETGGVFLNAGRDGPTIGIRRSRLSNEGAFTFCRTYLHELGHLRSGAPDYTREFTRFFEDICARRFLESRKR